MGFIFLSIERRSLALACSGKPTLEASNDHGSQVEGGGSRQPNMTTIQDPVFSGHIHRLAKNSDPHNSSCAASVPSCIPGILKPPLTAFWNTPFASYFLDMSLRYRTLPSP